MDGIREAQIFADAFGELLPDDPSIELVLIAHPPSISDILNLSAHYYGFDVGLMCNRSRRGGPLSRARHVAFYLCRTLRKPLKRIGYRFGFDHSSCYFGANKIAREIISNETLRDDVDILRMRMHDLVWRRVRGMTCH